MAAEVRDFGELSAGEQQYRLLKRDDWIRRARKSIADFGHFMLPDASDPDDPDKSEYVSNSVSRCLCSLIEEIETGAKRRVAVSTPPQHGKTIHLSLLGALWIWGRNPKARIVIATYNEVRAKELGKDILTLMRSVQYNQVFPEIEPDKLAQSQSYIQNTLGGRIMLVGQGGSITGKTADYFFIDDPIKGEEDESDLTPTALERLWQWFFKVAYSRGSNKTRMLITHTRWSEDDLIGRLCDPDHPERNKRFRGIAKAWFYLNMPAVVEDESLAKLLGLELSMPTDPDVVEMFGQHPMTTLWPENKDLSFYAEWKRGDERSFMALAMGKPAPEDGDFFRKEWFRVYHSMDELPHNLVYYGASDHAVSLKAKRDYTVLGCVGIDEQDNIWVLPDLVWDRMETPDTVDCIIQLLQRHKPVTWWLEDENIKKAFGPFLLRRMHEEGVYTTVMDGVRPAADKKTRGRSIQGRMSMGKVIFPAFAPWWPDAEAQMLRFPYGAHDDFVDFMSLFGLGLLKEYSADAEADMSDSDELPDVGTVVLNGILKRIQKGAEPRDTEGW